MNQANPFVISEFTNPSGEIVFRVSGWLQGKRVRKTFRIVARPHPSVRPWKSLGSKPRMSARRLLVFSLSAAVTWAEACSPGGGQRRRTAGESEERPESPRSCRIAPRSTMARRSSEARRALVIVGNRATALRAAARFSPPVRRSAPVDAPGNTTGSVSHLRKWKPYAVA